jgi:hypothetical protein
MTGSPSSYWISATEFAAYGTNIVVSEPALANNSLCVSWDSLPGAHYYLEGKKELSETNWTKLSFTLTASDVTTTFCLSLPSPYQYFRVSEGLVLVPSSPIISDFDYGTNGMLLKWSAPTNQLFRLQWTPGLAQANWHSISGIVTSTNGTFFFLDDGTQTGGLVGPRFYRLQQLR